MTKKTLVFVHGRSQQGRDPEKVKAEWLSTLALGLGIERAKRLQDVDIRFPFYGDLLEEFAAEMDKGLPPDILMRGEELTQDEKFAEFEREVALRLKEQLGLTDEQVDAEIIEIARKRGPLNWEWVQAIMRAADKIPGISATSIERQTRDVYMYLTRSKIRQTINDVVASQIPSSSTVVVGHSLGSVVAYDVLRTVKSPKKIPLYVTVGSPLGVGPISRVLLPHVFPPNVGHWFNASDDRDVVALNPLTKAYFDITPEIENYHGVKNGTNNAHGIVGYLNDPKVAAKIFAGLFD